MNIQYLKALENNHVTQEGYIFKPVDFTIGSVDENGINYLRDFNDFFVYFPVRITNYTYENYLNDFRKELNGLDHLSSENIIIALTHVFISVRNMSISTEKAWSDFRRNMFANCLIHLEFPTKLNGEGFPVNLLLRNFNIGKFDILTVKEKIKNNTISDFYDRFIKGNAKNEMILSECVSIKKNEEKINILNVSKLYFSKYFMTSDKKRIFDLYFNALSEQLFQVFWKELDEQLIESAAMGGAYYAPELFLQMAGVDGIQLAIYTYIGNNDKNGWVTPYIPKILEINYDSKLRIPLLNEKLKVFYEKMDLATSEYSRMIKILIQFLGNATKLLQENKVDEAFINIWVALDTLLNNDSEANSNKLKNRVAALSWYQLKSNQSDQYDIVSILYKLRSAYIHSGKSISRKDALILGDIAQNILDVLLNIHLYSVKIEPIKYIEWLLNIDRIIKLAYTNQLIEPELLKSTGITAIDL